MKPTNRVALIKTIAACVIFLGTTPSYGSLGGLRNFLPETKRFLSLTKYCAPLFARMRFSEKPTLHARLHSNWFQESTLHKHLRR